MSHVLDRAAPRGDRQDRSDAQLHRERRQQDFHLHRRPRRHRRALRRHAGSAPRDHSQRPALCQGFDARARRLPLRAPRHQGRGLLRRGRDQARLLPGDGSADQSRRAAPSASWCSTTRCAPPTTSCAKPKQIREVVRRVHNDYTEWSGPQRVRDILPDEADELLKRRFAIIQVWRPIRHPVETHPLAICDARSISPENFIISERRYPDRVGQTYAITHNPGAQVVLVPAPCAARRRSCSRCTIR